MSEYQHKTRPDRGWTPRDPPGAEQPRREPPPPPPPEWDAGPPPPRGGRVDLSSLFLVIDGLRRALPGELQQQFTSLVREVLLTLRSLIDWYLDRLDGRRKEPTVEDIPID
jgi:hypothetical protein